MRSPFRRKRIPSPGGEPAMTRIEGGGVLIRNTGALTGDELLDVGDGRTVRVADLLAGLDEIPVNTPEEGR
jgi:hypothetical protein